MQNLAKINNSVNLFSLLKAEWDKIWRLKFHKTFLIVTVIFGILVGTILVLTINVTQGKALSSFSSVDILSAGLLGMDATAIMMMIFTSISIAGEFSNNTMNISLIIMPKRSRLYLIRIMLFCIIGYVVGVITVIMIFFALQCILFISNLPLIPIANNTIFQMLIGCMIIPLFYSLVTLSFSFLIMKVGGAITCSIGVMCLSGIINIFPNPIPEILIPFMPQSAIHSLAAMEKVGGLGYLSLSNSILLLIGWTIFLLVIAWLKFRNKDL